ncbi:MAG TPA: thioredoxin family protein [Stellaceae bacterium]|nr:thioredoxin family protein [Stellaceae bacterium]
MPDHAVVTAEKWIAARRELLAKEKEFTRLRDELSRERRALPWMRMEKSYVFDTPAGRKSLAELFDGRRQLVVYHFMFAPDWQVPCKSCSFWADNFNGVLAHLNQRDVSMIAISRAPLAKIAAFKQRMGWTFPWVSSDDSDFNFDLAVSFRRAEVAAGKADYNFSPTQTTMSDLPGISVFYRDEDGAIFRTYSCYARGLDMMNVAYHYLDLVPKGRDEDGPHKMAWVRFHDEYGK